MEYCSLVCLVVLAVVLASVTAGRHGRWNRGGHHNGGHRWRDRQLGHYDYDEDVDYETGSLDDYGPILPEVFPDDDVFGNDDGWYRGRGRSGRGHHHRGRGGRKPYPRPNYRIENPRNRRIDAIFDEDLPPVEIPDPPRPRRRMTPVNRRRPDRFGQFRFTIGTPDWAFDTFDFDLDVELGGGSAWWQGPNVCVKEDKKYDKKETSASRNHFIITQSSRCEDNGKAYVCETILECGRWKNTTRLTYSCCTGFTKNDGESECSQALELPNMHDLAADLGLTEFLKAVSSVGLNETLVNSTVTVLAPEDNLWKEYVATQDLPVGSNAVIVLATGEDDESEGENKNVEQTMATVLRHIIPDTDLQSFDMHNEMVISSAIPENSLRINKYKHSGVITANCVKLKTIDQVASNGVIHIVSDIIKPITKNIMEIIEEDQQLSTFRAVVTKAGWNESLSIDEPLTLVVPTNDAFDKLGNDVMDKLVLKGKCLNYFIQAHVLPEVACSEGVKDRMKIRDMNRKKLNITRNQDGNLFIGSARVVKKDLVGRNGVVYVIDGVLGTEALSVLSAAEAEGLSDLAELVDLAGMRDELDSKDGATFLLPTNEAILQLSQNVVSRLRTNQQELRNLLNYHVLPQQYKLDDFAQVHNVNTYNTEHRILVTRNKKLWPWLSSDVRLQCAKIIKDRVKTCSNNTVHFIDQVLFPPTGNLLTILEADERFTKLVGLIKKAEIESLLQRENGQMTMLAPTNEALEPFLRRFSNKEISRRTLRAFLKTHILDGVHCCRNLRTSHGLSSSSGRYLFIHSDVSGDINVEQAVIEQCDIPATNGVLHVVNPAIRYANQFLGLLPQLDRLYADWL